MLITPILITLIQFASAAKLVPPDHGLYQGVFPDLPEVPAPIWRKKISEYESLIGKKVAFATILNDFPDGPVFPKAAVREVIQSGTVPFIRILPRSERVQGEGPEKKFQLELFANGTFDQEIRSWCAAAKSVRSPILVGFAQEPNGDWYGWGGFWNGGGLHTYSPEIPDGPYNYRQAYRRFVQVCRTTGADNITWFFHLDSQRKPSESWNKMAYYYPGDDVIDWIGLSVYGAQYPSDYWGGFVETLEPAYQEMAAISAIKPMAVLEMGVIEKPGDPNGKADWFREAFSALTDGRFPRIKGLTYWHESSWLPEGDNNFRIDSSPEALKAFREGIGNPQLLGRAAFR